MSKIILPIIAGIRKYDFILCAFLSVALLSGSSYSRSVPVTVIDGRGYISLHELTRLAGIEKSYDPVHRKGRLYYNNHYMVFKEGYSVVIIDNSLYTSAYEVRRHVGGIYLPADMAVTLASEFFSDMDVSLEGGKMSLSKKSAPEPDKKEKAFQAVNGRIGFIIIDPGHGGKDPGAVGKGGVREKDINLQISLKVYRILKKKLPGIKIKMTRDTDKFIELAGRADIANRELRKDHNGVFVSIHVNASISPKISGFETYFLSQNPTNEDARKTAALENNVIILENDNRYDDAEYMEALMITTQIQKESSLLANTVQKYLDRSISEFKSRGVHQADFFVLRGALMPAVLVETGFITNSKEASSLRRKQYQQKIASGISNGIINFIEQYNKMIDQ